MARLKKSYDMAEGKIVFILPNGEKMEWKVDELPDSIKEQAMYHGLVQKMGDKVAGVSSVAEMEGAFRALWNQLKEGTWNAGRGAGIGILAKALARVKDVDIVEAVAAIEKLSEEEKRQLKKHPAIKKAMLEIQMEELEGKGEGAEVPELPL